MTLNSAQMRDLELHSASFRAEAHKAYLAETISAIRATRQPSSAIQLLQALSTNARKEQQEAIVDVQRWLERRLREHPPVSADQLLLELGWLRRMCIARTAGVMPNPLATARSKGRRR